MLEQLAPGLPADWLNGWMAAIGACVLVPAMQLYWTDDPVPTACFQLDGGGPDVATSIADSLPSEQDLGHLAIARRIDARADLSRTVSRAAYADRAALARSLGDTSLSSTVTDLIGDTRRLGDLDHSPFDPPVPRGITLWERVVSCRSSIANPAADVDATLRGRGRRVTNNGLGFDVRRLTAGVTDAEKRVDPVVEVLAFCALSLFPMRGNGSQTLARGWDAAPGRDGAFKWCAWSTGLDAWAIDALLDLAPHAKKDTALSQRLGITTWYQTMPYQRQSDQDVTRAYGTTEVA